MSTERHRLRKSEIRGLEKEVGERFGTDLGGLVRGAVELLGFEGREVLVIEGEPLFLRTGRGLLPTLGCVDRFKLGRVVIDAGAVPRVADGAHVMAPGVVRADGGISAGDPVVVVEERYEKPIAVGLALVEGPLMHAPRGKVVENLHHVGDAVWEFLARSKKVKYAGQHRS